MKQERVLDSNPPLTSFVEKQNFVVEEAYKDSLQHIVEKTLLDNPKPHDDEFLMRGIQGFSPTRIVAKYLYITENMTAEGSSTNKINSVFAELVRKETEAYAAEFLYKSPVLQTEYEVSNRNGFPEVVSPHYDPNSPLHTHISLKERDGAVFDGVLNLERAILEAKNHSTILYGSSEGWNGTGLPFTEGQMHVVNIVDNEILDTTLRVSLGLGNFKRLIEALSKEEIAAHNEKELIKQISRTVISVPQDITPEEILNHMQKIVKTDVAWNRMKLKKGELLFDKTFTFDEIRTVIRNNNFRATNSEVKQIIKELSTYLENNSDTSREALADMVREIGKAALTISESVGVEVGELTERRIQKGDYKGATKFASESLGCDPVVGSALEEKYAKEGKKQKCTECGEYTTTLCGWCINCAKAGGNYKRIKQEEVQQGYEPLQKEDVTGSFLALIITSTLNSLSKN